VLLNPASAVKQILLYPQEEDTSCSQSNPKQEIKRLWQDNRHFGKFCTTETITFLCILIHFEGVFKSFTHKRLGTELLSYSIKDICSTVLLMMSEEVQPAVSVLL